MEALLTLPNAITLLRVFLVPAVILCLLRHRYDAAFWLFVSAGLGDWLDGFLARRLNQVSRIGAILDPVADKMIMVSVSVILAWQCLLPAWFACVLVLRDVVIVLGALAYHFLFGHVEMAPTRLSKFNTLLAFAVLGATLAEANGMISPGPVLPAAYWIVLATLLASGVNYVWIWGHRAAGKNGRSGGA